MNDNLISIEQRTISKVRCRIFPLLIIGYLFAFLDRMVVSFAALQMNEDLSLSATAFGLGASFFFLGYIIFEIPSNMVMEKVGAKKWMARILITWGIITACMMFVKSGTQLIVLRFLLGAAEAGFYPGMILYTTYWFPEKQRGVAISQMLIGAYVACIIGAPLAGVILQLHDFVGIRGWQWLFLLEGVPSVIIGIIFLALLVDKPEKAKWLEKEEKEWLVQTIAVENARKGEDAVKGTLSKALSSPTVLVSTLSYTFFLLGFYGLSYFLPQIIKALTVNSSTIVVTSLTALPYLGILFSILFIAPRSDKTGERKGYLITASLIAALGLAATTFAPNAAFALLFLTIFGIGSGIFQPVFWASSTELLKPSEAVIGIAFINSIASLGSFAGPYLIGVIKDATGTFHYGTLLLGISYIIAGIIIYSLYVKISRDRKNFLKQ